MMKKTMKAIIWTAYGAPEVLQLQEIDKPEPEENEVLIRLHATTVTAGDCEIRRLELPMGFGLLIRLFVGILKPKKILILGQEFAGEIEAVGSAISRFKPGDKVFGGSGFTKGTYAEFICLEEMPDEGVLSLKPENMSYQEAAAVTTGGLEALHFLRLADIQPGQHVLINGAGGSIGTFGIQMAKHFGAEVTAVDREDKLKTLLDIGADRVIDYTREDFTQSGEIYDVIFDVIGKSPFKKSINSLSDGGVYLIANPRLGSMLRGRWISRKGSKKVITDMTQQKNEDLEFLKELIEYGKLRSVIDHALPLEEIVKAHHFVESGAKRGNLVINIVSRD